MNIDEALLTAEEAMDNSVHYLKSELRGIRTGRASTALVEFVKVDYFDALTDLRQLAMISVPEPTQILVKPFDPSSLQNIVKGLQNAGLGLNPIAEGKQIRLNLSALTGDRRTQLSSSVKHMGEGAKVSVRNARRDANKHIDQVHKDKTQHLSEDDVETYKQEIQDLVKKYEKQVQELVTAKSREIQEV